MGEETVVVNFKLEWNTTGRVPTHGTVTFYTISQKTSEVRATVFKTIREIFAVAVSYCKQTLKRCFM